MIRFPLFALAVLSGLAASNAALADPHNNYFRHDEEHRLHRAEARRHWEEEHDDHWRDRRHHGHYGYVYEPARPAYIAPAPYAGPFVETRPGLNLNVSIP